MTCPVYVREYCCTGSEEWCAHWQASDWPIITRHCVQHIWWDKDFTGHCAGLGQERGIEMKMSVRRRSGSSWAEGGIAVKLLYFQGGLQQETCVEWLRAVTKILSCMDHSWECLRDLMFPEDCLDRTARCKLTSTYIQTALDCSG